MFMKVRIYRKDDYESPYKYYEDRIVNVSFINNIFEVDDNLSSDVRGRKLYNLSGILGENKIDKEDADRIFKIIGASL